MLETVVFERLYGDVRIPTRATRASAGYDVRAHINGRDIQAISDLGSAILHAVDGELTIPPMTRAIVPLGFKARLPPDVEGQIRLRSSTAFGKGLILPSAPVTIDSDYPGEWVLLVANPTASAATIAHNERIAHVVFAKYTEVRWICGPVGQSSDRTGGLGSTGKN